ncbi:hypothetical protein FHW96_001760 [Novosphingobium sp. SG751A]|uniref:hypothetical protein n=1 Tax=Novosphingobium sp. SG751A TaxID=2587000 RepID=UPI00155423F0|nr:hypothetical protein [Novosphingobium sp. SG751A]NOW45605.1 hypothetical protein [Novosphingobium sp. SG751A]
MIDILARKLATQASSNAASAVRAAVSNASVPTQAGAVGDGNSAASDQAGVAACIATVAASRSAAPTGILDLYQYQSGIEIEPGIYDAGDFTMSDCKLWLKARIPGTVVIRIPADKYFLTVTGQLMSMYVDGIMFLGGKGFLKCTRTSTNASQNMRITNCMFGNYTECAISNNSVDSPFLKIDNCQFGGNGANIGIAWGGYVDQLVIENCAIGGNDYGIAIGPRLSANYNIQKNDLLQNRKADIWIKPNITESSGTNAGWAGMIKQNKFGGETQTMANPYPRILIANEDTSSGTDRATCKPWIGAGSDVGYLVMPTIKDNLFAQISGWSAPAMRCYISNLQYGFWENNKFTGGANTYVMEFPNGRTSNFVNNSSVFIFRESDGSVPVQFSTHPFARLEDYGSFWPGTTGGAMVHPLSDNPTLSLIGNGLSPSLRGIYGTGTAVSTADQYGGNDFDLVTCTNTGTGAGKYIGVNAASLAAGGMVFVEIGLQQAPTRSVSRVLIELVNYSNSQWAMQRTILLPATFGRFLLPVYLPPNVNTGSWQLKCYAIGSDVVSGTTDQLIIGDMIVNTGGGRMGRDRALARYPVQPRNVTMLGGAQSTWPTGWSQGVANGLAGLTTAVNSVGVDADGYYVEVALSGTVTAAGAWVVYPDVLRSINMAYAQCWQWYTKIKLVSGSLSTASSATGTDGSTGQMQMQWWVYSSADSLLQTYSTAMTPTTTIGNYGHSKWNGFHSQTAYARPSYGLTFASGAVVSLVLRIYQPVIRRLG